MKIKKANDGPLTNFEVLNLLQSRGASKEVAVTVSPSEYKVFEYLVETPARSQTKEMVTALVQKVKKYDLAKAEVFNIINTRPSLPVLFAIVDNCEQRLGIDGAEELLEMVTDTLPAPSEAEQPQDQDSDDAAETADGDQGIEADKQ